MKEKDIDFRLFCLHPEPPELPWQEYIDRYFEEKNEDYLAWYLHYSEGYINHRVKGIEQNFGMHGHFACIKAAYVAGIGIALLHYDHKRGVPFQNFSERYIMRSIHDTIRSLRPGLTASTEGEYAKLRKTMAIYAQHEDSETAIEEIAKAVGCSVKTARERLAGGIRTNKFVDFIDHFNDAETSALTVNSNTEPLHIYLLHERWKTLSTAWDKLEYRERQIVAAHLGFCPDCWSTIYRTTVNGKQVIKNYKERSFADIAAEHMITPAAADRIYRGALKKLRKAIESE